MSANTSTEIEPAANSIDFRLADKQDACLK